MTARHRWGAVFCIVTALAASMSCGTLHAIQGSDSIVPVLVSLQRWTPFFWQQDRFGMLVPLIVMPLRDPLLNLAVQGWLMTSAALLAPFLVARLLVQGLRSPWGRTGANGTPEPADAASADWFAAGAVANILLLLLASDFVRFDWFIVQPYALSVALAAAGLIAAERPGRAAPLAVALMVLAHWVNAGVVVLAAPLAMVRRRSAVTAVAVTLIGAAAGAGLTRLSPYHTPTALLPPVEWPHAWLELLGQARQAFPNRILLGGTVSLALFMVIGWVRRSRATVEKSPLTAAGIALLMAIVYWLVAGTSRWVQLNLYLPRYIYPSFLMCGVAAGILMGTLPRRFAARASLAAVVVALGALTLADYGVPSHRRLVSTIDARVGRLTPDVIATGATVIGGDYWAVWPAVFHANLTRYRLGRPAVYGLTYRSAPTNDLWKGRSGVVLASAAGDAMIAFYARRSGLTISRVGRHGAVDIYTIQKAN